MSMTSIENLTPKDIKYNKIWTSKDKFIFRDKLGPHWYLKKTLVIWKYFLIDRKPITNESLKEIADIFQKFIDSIPDDVIKKSAEEYFFNPQDFRKPKTIIDFEKFNDGDENEELSTRKIFITYLMGIGGQSCLKKFIKQSFSDSNITITKIKQSIPGEQKRLKTADPDCNGLDDSVSGVMADYPAEIRNLRQLFSYRGITPQEEDGHTFNEISKLCCTADSTLIMSIWEHQKIKMRVDNPWTRKIRSDNPEEKFKVYNDFQDFATNNYLSLILVLDELYQKDARDAYISFEDYKFVISRAVPFEIKSVVKCIKHFRSLSAAQQQQINKVFNQRPKTRTFSKKKGKTGSEDFYKEIANLVYGISEYKFTTTTKIYNNLLKFDSGKLTINKPELFEIFTKYLENVHKYVNTENKELYEKVSRYVSLKQIDEIYNRSDNEKYKKKLIEIRKRYLKNQPDDLAAYYGDTLRDWNRYITTIDDKLLIYSYASVLVLNNYQSIKNNKSAISNLITNAISDDLVNVIGTEKSDMIQILEKIILDILNKQSFSKINYKLTSKISDDDKWIADQLQSSSMSVLLQKLKKIDSDLMYDIDKKGKRSRKRNTKLMRLILKERLDGRIVMNKKRTKYLVDQCDICEKKFGVREPQCHHMIPFERRGPDDSLNYAFLCNECHKIFTYDEFSEKAKDAIDQLKLRNLVSRENYKEMIENNLLTPDLIEYLHRAGYIHLVQKMELRKIWNEHENIRDENFKPKTMPSGERWGRGMYTVYEWRIRHKLIMEQVKDDYKTDSCDGCDVQFKKSEPECHHIIPKAQKFKGQAPKGPESSYNYAFLCSNCHQKFTSQKPERIVIVKKLKNKGLVIKETVKKMILHDGLNKLQLDYLQAENYIDKTEHKELLQLMIQKKNYLN